MLPHDLHHEAGYQITRISIGDWYMFMPKLDRLPFMKGAVSSNEKEI